MGDVEEYKSDAIASDLVASVKQISQAWQQVEVAGGRSRLSIADHIVNNLDYVAFVDRLLEAFSEDRVRTFFGTADARNALLNDFFHNVTVNCVMRGTELAVHEHGLRQYLRQLEKAIYEGTTEFVWSIRVANIDLPCSFELGDGITFRKLRDQEVIERYPCVEHFDLHGKVKGDRYPLHTVEVMQRFVGNGADIMRTGTRPWMDSWLGSILLPFSLSPSLAGMVEPAVMRTRLESPIRRFLTTHQDIRFATLPRMLSRQDIHQLKAAFLLMKNSQNDPQLSKSLNRFLVAEKTSRSHPLATDAPNWDKVVDYVIAMETIISHHNIKSPPMADLTYRFRLNGAKIIANALGSLDIQSGESSRIS